MIKTIKLTYTFIIALVAFSANAQVSTIAVSGQAEEAGVQYPIFSYGDEMVYNDEFMRVFNKNNRKKTAPSKTEIEEYLDLYIKFKLKVAEAYSRQMDTVPSFINELAGYRAQLAQPYLTDKNVTDRLIREAYERSIQEVNASHLLINCALDAKPVDSLAAYQKIMGLRNRVVVGAKFDDIASQFSEDPSAKTNKGDLGYFTAFQMIYPFENAAFKTPVGEVSQPIRTQFGYHLVYVKDRRNSFGDIKVAHIMINYYNQKQVDSTKQRIDAVYEKLKGGADWETTVEEFSEDFNSKSKGGELSWFNRTSSNIPTEFKDVAYTLKENGDFTQPVKTKFGWHIVRRVDLKPILSFDESKDRLRRKVERDSRSELNKDVVVARIKKENKYKELGGLPVVKNSFDKDLLNGSYKREKGKNIPLFSIDDKNYMDADFYTYVAANQSRSNKSLDNTVLDLYSKFVKESNLNYEQSILENKYDDFKHIMKEYKDGILLFSLTDEEVWSKAVADSTGLAAFYTNNQSNYVWADRADASLYSCKDAKSAKQAMKLAKRGTSPTDILSKCNVEDPLTVKVENKKFEKGSNPLLDKIEWQKGIFPLASENDRSKFVVIGEIIPSSNKKMEDNMGQATSDYQNFLEKRWIEALKKKFPINVYDNNVKKLYN